MTGRENVKKFVKDNLQVVNEDEIPRCKLCNRKLKLNKKPTKIVSKNGYIYEFYVSRCSSPCYNINTICIKKRKINAYDRL